MPVLHERKGTEGVYLKANVEGSIITLQVRHSAAGLLESLGYEDESKIPWQIIIPLQIVGHIYTKKGGPSNEENLPEMTDAYVSRLSDNQKKKLREYLNLCPGLSPEQAEKINRFFGSGTASASEGNTSSWAEFSSKYSPENSSKKRSEKVSSLHDIYISVTGEDLTTLPPNHPTQPRTESEHEEAVQLVKPTLSEDQYVGTVEKERGTYGFIDTEEYDESVFFHQSFVDDWEIEEGTLFIFEIEVTDKGPQTRNMEFVNPWSEDFSQTRADPQ